MRLLLGKTEAVFLDQCRHQHLMAQRRALLKKEEHRTPQEVILCQLFAQSVRAEYEQTKRISPEDARKRMVVHELAESAEACREQRWRAAPGFRYKKIALDDKGLRAISAEELRKRQATRQEQESDPKKQPAEDILKARKELLQAVRVEQKKEKMLATKEEV